MKHREFTLSDKQNFPTDSSIHFAVPRRVLVEPPGVPTLLQVRYISDGAIDGHQIANTHLFDRIQLRLFIGKELPLSFLVVVDVQDWQFFLYDPLLL